MFNPDHVYRLGIMLAAVKSEIDELGQNKFYGKALRYERCREAQSIRRQMQEA